MKVFGYPRKRAFGYLFRYDLPNSLFTNVNELAANEYNIVNMVDVIGENHLNVTYNVKQIWEQNVSKPIDKICFKWYN